MEKDLQISKWDYHSAQILPFICALGDYIAILLSEKLALGICAIIFTDEFTFDIPNVYFFIWIPLIYIFFLFYTGAHKRMIPFWEVIRNTFYANFYSTIVSIFILYLIHSSDKVSRVFVILFFILSFILLCAMRQILVSIVNKLDIFKEAIIFIGAGNTTETIIKYFKHNNCFGVKVAGIVDDSFRSDYLKENFRLLKSIDNAIRYIGAINVKTVIIAAPKMDKYRLIDIINQIQPVVKNILFVPNIIGTPVANIDIKRLYADNLLLLDVKNNLASVKNRFTKRVFDIVMGLIICIPVVPTLVLLCIWVRLDSKGPVFFNAKRIGKDNKNFTCYKFRSMYMNSDKILDEYLAKNPEAKIEWDEFQKLKDYDPRVTKAGKIMRKLSLDELPQIFNVLKGDMSLVGPRPYLPREIEKMGIYFPIIIKTVPGITGFWQVSGRSDVSFQGRLRMDDWYIRNWSVWIDVVLLFKTIKAVFFSKGAV